MNTRSDGPHGLRAVLDAARIEFAAMMWFSSLGQPATPAEEAQVRAYAEALSVPEPPIGWVDDWREAEALTREASGADWWAAENALQETLLDTIGPVAREPSYTTALNETVHVASDQIMGAAAVAAARVGLADQAVIRVAAGAAGQAVEQALLARLANQGPNHPFEVKLNLFGGGRWPLGMIGGSFRVF